MMVKECESTPYILLWRIMANIDELKQLIEPILKDIDLELYSLKWLKDGENILQVMITNPQNQIDLDACVLASEKIGDMLDEVDPIPEEYSLEVCSPGAEREIDDISSLKNMVGAYVLVKLAEPFKQMNEIQGEIVESNDEEIVIAYRDKAATRKANLAYPNIVFARYAVKL